ncbi:MAG: hypothetical protein ABMA15_04390 [Vicinamibacterales bacterium]
MTWAQFHSASETAAIEAEQAYRDGQTDRAELLYAKAADLEQQALGAVDTVKARTRGVTAVSAVSLWYKAAAFGQAEQLAHSMLADPALPPFAKTDLRNLVQAIWTESAKKEAKIGFLPGQVFVSVKGGEVITGGAPLDLVVEKVQTIQSMFYRTIEFIKDMPFRSRGGPAAEIQESCRPWLFQTAPGSYQFSVAIQEPKQLDFFREDVRPELIANRFLEILRATSTEDQQTLETLVPKPAYRNAFLKLSRNLAPTGKTFDAIEFRTATKESRVALTAEDRRVINQTIRGARPADVQGSPDSPEQEITGVLRAVDLDKDSLDVVVEDQTVHVVGLGDTMDDVIGPMVNKRVKLTAVSGAKGSLRLRDIELDD